MTFEPPEVAGECSFCGVKIVAQPKSADPLVSPEALLPFGISSRQSTDSVRKWLASRWFAPNVLKKLAYQESIDGVYLPFGLMTRTPRVTTPASAASTTTKPRPTPSKMIRATR